MTSPKELLQVLDKIQFSKTILTELYFYNFQFLSVSTAHNICNPLDHKLFVHDELNLSTVVIQVYLT